MLIYIYIRPFGVVSSSSPPKVHLKAVVLDFFSSRLTSPFFLFAYLMPCLSISEYLLICIGHGKWGKDERKSKNTNCQNWFDCVLNLMFIHIRCGIKVNLCEKCFFWLFSSTSGGAVMSIDELRCLITQMIHKKAQAEHQPSRPNVSLGNVRCTKPNQSFVDAYHGAVLIYRFADNLRISEIDSTSVFNRPSSEWEMREVLVIVGLFAVVSAAPLGACEWDENMLGTSNVIRMNNLALSFRRKQPDQWKLVITISRISTT